MQYRLIAHEIRKKQHQKKADVFYRKTVNPENARAANLVEEIRTSFKKNSAQGVKFKSLDGELAPLQTQIGIYGQDADLDNVKFINFTEIATRKLRSCMEDEPASVGGYLVFTEYTYGGEKYLVIVLLSSKSRAHFDSDINLKQVTTLDIDHVRHAVRFRLSGVSSNAAGCVQIVAKSSEGNFFRDFTDCEMTSDSKIQANLLRTALTAWGESKKLTEEEKEVLMKNTHSYWLECKKSAKNMSLVGLANSLYPNNPDEFLNHISSESNDLEGEFAPPRQSDMQQFKKFAFSGKGLKIEFDRKIWHNKIKASGNVVTITGAPEALLDQIRRDAAL